MDDKAGLGAGYTHLQLPTLLKDETVSVDILRYERYLSFRVNGYSEIIISDGIAKDGVVQVPNHVLIPPCPGQGKHHDEDGFAALAAAGESVRNAQVEGEEVDLEDLKTLLEPYLENGGGRLEEEL